ncbi:MAG: prepilin-type N-terminal cleavage/methylation domain-containing protein, partial [Mailhella sp.]|nr:prepilin-type N-terminal cleavage/methylation domain-containing protein [Mailhella sp.]
MFFRKLAQALSSSRTSKISRERGFTLIEVLGAIIVGAIIFAFAAFAIRNGIESAKVSNQNDSLANLRVNIQEAFSTLHSYEDLSNANALAARIVPTNMLTGATDDAAYGDAIVNEWNGAITLAPTE